MACWPKPSDRPFRLECDVLLWVRKAGWLPGLAYSTRKQDLLLLELVPLFELDAMGLRTAGRDPEFSLSSGASGVAADGALGSVCDCNQLEAKSGGCREALWLIREQRRTSQLPSPKGRGLHGTEPPREWFGFQPLPPYFPSPPPSPLLLFPA